MTDRSVNHATFTLERTYPVDTARVWEAWSEPELKARWFAGSSPDHTLDFTVGGHEVAKGTHDGQALRYETTYLDIVPGERITYSATMHFDGALGTASLNTVEFISSGDATRLVVTEHGAFLDGYELPEWRETGTSDQLKALGEMLAKPGTT